VSHESQLPKDEEKTTSESQQSFYESILAMLTRMCEIYRSEMTAELAATWSESLKGMSPELMKVGLKRTLRMHEDFLPTPAQFLKYAEEAAGELPKRAYSPIVRRRNVMDEVVDVAREMFPGYDDLDMKRDAEQIKDCCRKASLVRYMRMGLFPIWASTRTELKELHERYVEDGYEGNEEVAQRSSKERSTRSRKGR
jgi:hypothetical protein